MRLVSVVLNDKKMDFHILGDEFDSYEEITVLRSERGKTE